MAASVFARTTEQDAYTLLHRDGFDAFHDRYGTGIAYDLINRWANKGLCRITHTDAGMGVHTYKKYAGKRGDTP